jgi:hypothetical protein
VVAFTYPIAWLLETFRLWRVRPTRHALDHPDPRQLQHRAMTAADIYHELKTPIVLPPL